VAAAKALAQEFAVETASGIFELAGASATDSQYARDRHWRNVRVHSLHDPARWKYVHLGIHTLNHTLPPRLGVLLWPLPSSGRSFYFAGRSTSAPCFSSRKPRRRTPRRQVPMLTLATPPPDPSAAKMTQAPAQVDNAH
jgi:Acyl-CoA dehydrogenase, C-terminal domain